MLCMIGDPGQYKLGSELRVMHSMKSVQELLEG